MSRYIQSFTSALPEQQVNNCVATYLTSEGFELKAENGEYIWKKGVGMLTAPQYIKLSYQNGVYVIEAWLKFAILPGVYVSEMGLTGFVGCIPKSMLKSRVDSLLSMLQARLIQSSPSQFNSNINIQPQIQGNNVYAQSNMPQQMQGNVYANQNIPQQMQGNVYANQNTPQQMQGNVYANQNTPHQTQGNVYDNRNMTEQSIVNSCSSSVNE